MAWRAKVSTLSLAIVFCGLAFCLRIIMADEKKNGNFCLLPNTIRDAATDHAAIPICFTDTGVRMALLRLQPQSK